MKNEKVAVFFDFDNTITPYDVLDDMLVRFSINDRWKDLEAKWKSGEMGSRECLAGQLKGIRVTKRALDEYLSKIRIDPYFKRLLKFFRSKKIKAVVLSDSFDYILHKILHSNGIRSPKIYSNRVTLKDDKLVPRFPFIDKKCRTCAHCKNNDMRSRAESGSRKVYIGDGLSDVCPSKCADIVFAKDYLLEYYKAKGIPCVAFKNFKDIYNYFKEELS